MVPTRRFWLLVALGIPVAGFAMEVGSPGLALLYNALIIVVAVVSGYLAPSHKGLRVERKLDAVLSVRVQNKIDLTVTNDGAEPIRFFMRDEPPPDFETVGNERYLELLPNKLAEYSYTTKPFLRGGDFFRGTFLRIKCPLGLVFREVRLETEQPIRIYPNVLALKEFDLLKQKGRLRELGVRKSRMRGLGTEFESLREYADGDDFRKIDWKASARRGKLVSRVYEQERNQAVLICVDVGRHMLAESEGVRKLDRALDACLMLTHAAGIAGDLVGLLVYSDRVMRYIPPRKGRNQQGIVIEAIHDLIAEPIESDPISAMIYLGSRWKRRSLMVLFSDIDGPDGAERMVAALGPLARRHLALLARVSDPRLERLYDQPLEDRKSFFERTAADLLISERRKVSLILNQAGVHNLEAEPDDLSAALVNFYFVVKERSLI
jgi:uncharacterized protein (DUF58 family)